MLFIAPMLSNLLHKTQMSMMSFLHKKLGKIKIRNSYFKLKIGIHSKLTNGLTKINLIACMIITLLTILSSKEFVY
jgi:hypothetical protein